MIRPGWIEGSFKSLGPRTEPGAAVLLLTAGLTEGRGSDQRLPGRGPPIGMRIMGVVHVQVIKQLRLKGVDRTKVPALEKTASQHPKPQCYLIEPRPVFGRKMHHMLRRWIAQERPPLYVTLERLRVKREIAPRRHQAAYLQAPVRIESIDHPVIALHGGEVVVDVGQMCGKVLTGAGRAERPQDLSGWYHKGGDQDPHPMTDVLLLTFFWLPWLGQLRGIFTLENLHARFFVTQMTKRPCWKKWRAL